MDSVPALLYLTDWLLTILLPWLIAVAPTFVGGLLLS